METRTLILLLNLMLMQGCSTLFGERQTPPAPPPAIVKQKVMVHIECILPAPADGIKAYITDPTVIETSDGKMWVAWAPKNYERLSKNLAQIQDGWGAKIKTIKYLKNCIIRSRVKLKTGEDDE